MKLSRNNRADSQTGSAKGGFKRGDEHPFMEDRYFRTYAKTATGGYKECWSSAAALSRHKKDVALHGKEKPDMHKARNERWYVKNRKDVLARRAARHKEKMKNPVERVKSACRSRLKVALDRKSLSKESKTFKTIGISPEQLKEHLEGLFVDGMTWDNMGSEWHIDHIIPLSCATTIDGVEKLCHYTNLQPLWAIDNIKKGANLQLCQN